MELRNIRYIPKHKKEAFHIATTTNEPLVNEEITVKEVRLINEEGNQVGIVPIETALRMASEANLDLVNISPKADPPVCRIVDYGKYRFEQVKKQKEAKKNQKVTEIKEMRLSPMIDMHDMEVKAKNVSKFLDNGDKVKVSVRFRGRQLSHTTIGKEVMDAFVALVPNCTVEKDAKMDGRSMIMILAPKN